MADIFQRAWGNYVALFEFLTKSNFDESKGIIQPYNLATLYSYNLQSPNYNLFLLQNAVNYVGPTAPTDDNSEHTAERTNLARINRLTDAYETFLTGLDELIAKSIDPTEKPEYARLQEKVSDARGKLEAFEVITDGKWQTHVERNPGIPSENLRAERVIWERDHGYSMERDRLSNSVVAANVKANGWLRAQLPPEYSKIVDARRYFDDRNFWINLPIAAQFDNDRMKDMWRRFPAQFPLLSLDEFLTNNNEITHTFTSEEEHYRRVETKWSSSAKARWGFFSAGGSVERREMEELSTKSSFSMTVGFQRFDEVEVFRDAWFQDALFGTVGATMRNFWGPTGTLACIPVSLIMARAMKVEVKISEEYRNAIERFFATGGSFSFGPFSVGGNYSKDERSMDFKRTGEGFLLSDASKTIRILGARVRRNHWDQRGATKYYEGITTKDVDKLGALHGSRERP